MLQFDRLPLLDEVEDDECKLQRVVGVDNFRNGNEVEDRVIILSLRKRGPKSNRVKETQLHTVSLIPNPDPSKGGTPMNNGRPPSLLYNRVGNKPNPDKFQHIVHAASSFDKRFVVYTELCQDPANERLPIYFRTVAVLKSKGEVEILREPLCSNVYFFKEKKPIFSWNEPTWVILCISDHNCKRIKVDATGSRKMSFEVEDNKACNWHQWDAVNRQLVILSRDVVWLFDFTKDTDAYMKYELKGQSKFVRAGVGMTPTGAPIDIPLPTPPLPYSSANRSSNQEINFAFLEFFRETGEKDYVLCQQKPAIVMDRNDDGDVIGQRVLNRDVLEVNIDVWRSLQRFVLRVDLTPYFGGPMNPDENPLFKSLLQDNAVGLRASFFLVNSVLCIVLPNVCVSYVDITHRNRPPRLLFTAAWPEPERVPARCMCMLPLQRHPSCKPSYNDFDSVAIWFTPSNQGKGTTHSQDLDLAQAGKASNATLGTWVSYTTKAKMWQWITFQLANRGSVQKIRRALHLVTMHVPNDGTSPQSPNRSLTSLDHTPQAQVAGAGGTRSPDKSPVPVEDQDVAFLVHLCKKVSYRLLTADVLVEYLLSSASKHWRTKQKCQAVPFDGECLKRSEELLLTGPKRHPPGFIPVVPDELMCNSELVGSPGSPTTTHPGMPITQSVANFGSTSFQEVTAVPSLYSGSARNSSGAPNAEWEGTPNNGNRSNSDPVAGSDPSSGSAQSPHGPSNAAGGQSVAGGGGHYYAPPDTHETVMLDAPFMMFPKDIEDFILKNPQQPTLNTARRRPAGHGSGGSIPLSMTASIRLLTPDTAPSIGGDSEYVHLTTEEFKRAFVGLPPGDAHKYATLYHQEMKLAVLRIFKAFREVFDKSPRKFFHVLHNLQHALTALCFPAPPDVRYEMTSLASKLLPPEALIEGMRSGIYRATVNPESESFLSSSGGGFRDTHGSFADLTATRGSAVASGAVAWGGHKDVVLGNALPLCCPDQGDVDLQKEHYPLYHNLLMESTIHEQERDAKHIRCEQLYHDTRSCLQLMDDHLPKDCPVSAPIPVGDWYSQGGKIRHRSARSLLLNQSATENLGRDQMIALYYPFSRWDPYSEPPVESELAAGGGGEAAGGGEEDGTAASKAEFRRQSKQLLVEGVATRRHQSQFFPRNHLLD